MNMISIVVMLIFHKISAENLQKKMFLNCFKKQLSWMHVNMRQSTETLKEYEFVV